MQKDKRDTLKLRVLVAQEKPESISLSPRQNPSTDDIFNHVRNHLITREFDSALVKGVDFIKGSTHYSQLIS